MLLIPLNPEAYDVVKYDTSSTISPTKQPTDNTTDVPLLAVNSLELNLIPFTYTSKNPTLYVKLNVV